MKNYVLVIATGIVVSVATTIGIDPEQELMELHIGGHQSSKKIVFEEIEFSEPEELSFESVFGQLEESPIFTVEEIEEVDLNPEDLVKP